MEKRKVGPETVVSYAYRLYDDKSGELLFEALSDAPDTMVYGVSEDVVPGLEAAMNGLAPGDRFEVTLPPEAAFGPVMKENVVSIDKSVFERDGKLADEVKVGAMLPMLLSNGYRVQGIVKEIGDDKVVMDFNHPFAGKTVRYEGEIVDTRKATPEELKPAHGCGGCCGGGGGECGGGDCSGGDCGGGGCCH